MKYIVTKNIATTEEEIFLFPNTVNHDCMGEVLEGIKNQTHDSRDWRMAISAGFVDINGTCYGNSESLGLESRPAEDTELLEETYYV